MPRRNSNARRVNRQASGVHRGAIKDLDSFVYRQETPTSKRRKEAEYERQRSARAQLAIGETTVNATVDLQDDSTLDRAVS